jgi:hypothetical protein
MRYPDPVISIQQQPGGVTVVARYETPEIARAMLSLRGTCFVAAWSALSGGSVWAIISAGSTWSSGVWLLAVALTIILGYGIAHWLAEQLLNQRFFLGTVVCRQLTVRLTRRQAEHRDKIYDRGLVLRFTAAPHRHGKLEERGERHAERLQPTTYRDAAQVWLQHGEAFVLLAAVSDERGAEAVARALQAADEQVGRPHADDDDWGARQAPQ